MRGIFITLPGAAGPPIKIARKATVSEMSRKMGIPCPAVACVSEGETSITVPVRPETTAQELVRQLTRPPEPAPPAPSASAGRPPTWLIVMCVIGEALLLWLR